MSQDMKDANKWKKKGMEPQFIGDTSTKPHCFKGCSK